MHLWASKLILKSSGETKKLRLLFNPLLSLSRFNSTGSCVFGTHESVVGVVVPRKRVKRPELHPSLTEGGRRVSVEAADVGAHQRDAEHAEAQQLCQQIHSIRMIYPW